MRPNDSTPRHRLAGRAGGVLLLALVALALVPAVALASAEISGNINGGVHVPIQGAEVTLYVDNGSGSYIYDGKTVSNSLGNYSFSVPSGTYKILASTTSAQNYASWFYSKTGGANYIEGASPIEVSNTNVEKIDIQTVSYTHLTLPTILRV